MIIRETKDWLIELDADEEIDSPDETHDWSVCDRDKFYADLESGKFIWFRAAVRMHHKPSDCCLGSSFLGGCCYKSLEDFAQNGSLADMVNEVIAEARLCHESIVGSSLDEAEGKGAS